MERFEITQVIANGKQANSDWLPENPAAKDMTEILLAMANTQGGQLIIGVDNDATLQGVNDTDKCIDRLLQAALSISPPLIMPLPQVHLIQGKTAVVATIPSGMPYVYSHEGRYLKREGANNIPLSSRELRRLMMERGQFDFETEMAHGATLEAIDWQKAETYVKGLSGISETDVQKVLLQRGCLTPKGEQLVPTNAGILLFGKEPQRFLRGAEVTAARFASEAMSDTFNRQDITGTLPDQIRRAETFLADHLRKDVTLQHTMQRREDYEVPMEAARELVVNAVAHRDYSIQGDTIRLFLFSNRMEVHSPGGLPGPMTLTNLKDERFSRNPVIVQVLSDMGFIERLGYGVDRVMELMSRQQLSAPDFNESAAGFRVILHNAVTKAEQLGDEETASDQLVFNGMFQGVEINPRQEAALVHLHSGNSRITNSDLNTLYPEVHPETIRRDLVKLVEQDILIKMGQKRGSYYVLKSETLTPEEA